MGVAVDDMRQFEVLREALLNMLMHTDQFNPLRSCIHVFNDRIEFINGGNFPRPINQIREKFFSSLRNPTVAKLFRFTKLCENAGYGMDKLYSWEILTGKNITIHTERNMVTITLPLKNMNEPQNEPQKTLIRKQNKLNRRLTIIELIEKDVTITREQMAEELNVSLVTLKRDLAQLREQGILHFEGYSKTGRWYIDKHS